MLAKQQEHHGSGIRDNIGLSLNTPCDAIPPCSWCRIRHSDDIRGCFLCATKPRLTRQKKNYHDNLTNIFVQTRPRHPHTPPHHTQMLPYDQRRAGRAHRRRRAPTATVERRQHEQSPRRASKAVQNQARRHGEVEGSSESPPVSSLTPGVKTKLIIISICRRRTRSRLCSNKLGMVLRWLYRKAFTAAFAVGRTRITFLLPCHGSHSVSLV